MKGKKKLTGIILFLFVAAYAVRIYQVNVGVDLAEVKIYQKGDVVPFEKDFSDSVGDNAEGYTLQVLDTEILPVKEFIEKYDLEGEIAEDGFIQYYYLVKISCGNTGNKKGAEQGISLPLISLVGTNYYAMMNSIVFMLLNPDMPGDTFSLREDSTLEMIVPYPISEIVQTDMEELQEEPPRLQLTEYPCKKMIQL